MASLNTNSEILGDKNARHLIRRTCFSYNKELISQFSKLTPSEATKILFLKTTSTIDLPYDPLPIGNPDGFWTTSSKDPISFDNQERKASIVSAWWWYNAIHNSSIEYKMVHFLSTRFTVEKANGAGSASEFYDYLRLLHFYALGNYKTLAQKMTLNNSMLNYLNNTSNIKSAPNENYAREFLELFTIGKGNQIAPGDYTNYTEADIVQAARVITGYKRKSDRSILDPDSGIPCGNKDFIDHNTASKTFSNAFQNTTIKGAQDSASMDTELEQFITLIFNQKETSKAICRKLYTYFVSSTITQEIENDIITPLSEKLLISNYELQPVLKILLESIHFYDLDDANSNDEIIGGLIKSPIQQISEIVSFLKMEIPNPTIQQESFYITFWNDFVHNTFLKGANMLLFDPENVAGHPAFYQAPDFDKNWISASTLIARYRLGESLLDGKNRIEGNLDIIGKINITQVLRDNKIVSAVEDPFILTSELCNALFGQVASEERVNYFMNTFLLQGQPPGDWTSLWGFYIEANFNAVVDLRLNALLKAILKAPEAQMF